MPVVSVSLSEVGYEGYKELPKGKRSEYIDRMLRDYALERHTVTPRAGQTERLTVRQVLDRQQYLEQTIKTLNHELKEARQ
jgi:metal-responsive CopG/Arc/MetJ family transcriptional regulator